MIIVLSGPGGAGKGTVARRLVERNPEIYLSKSWTTRPCRKGEDNAYIFVDEQTFKEQVQKDSMLEWIEFEGHYYGTPFSELKLEENSIVLLEIDVQGAKKVKELYPDQAVLIFLEAPTLQAQIERLQKRGDSSEHVEKRVQRAERERQEAKELPAVWIINDDLMSAVTEIEEVISQKNL